ncbi:hypothetical protein PT974_10197 [Cladobotryum mycophilum]|uniref:Uncharacterized protein n=1 Tax=Cladobotryum mycophilum TaxID=491253 RepID=A0ABR0S963_9HYPO
MVTELGALEVNAIRALILQWLQVSKGIILDARPGYVRVGAARHAGEDVSSPANRVLAAGRDFGSCSILRRVVSKIPTPFVRPITFPISTFNTFLYAAQHQMHASHMPASSPLKEKGRHSNPFMSPNTSSHRSSARASTGSRSLSPKKPRSKQPLHIRMDLTEMQMDRITDAFTNKVNNSPVSNRQKADVTPSRSTPLTGSETFSRSGKGQRRANNSMDLHHGRSPTFSELMPRHKVDSIGLAERRRREPPVPIHVTPSRTVARTPRRPLMEAVPDLISPLSAEKLTVTMGGYDTEPSMYSPEEYETSRRGHSSQESPSPNVGSNINDEVLKMYTDWVRIRSPDTSTEPKTPKKEQRSQLPHHSTTTFQDVPQYDDYLPPSPLPRPPPPLAAPRMVAPRKTDTPMFSPLPLYFRGQDFPTVKKGEKTMIGQNGWLERTRSPDKQKQTPQKKPGILDSIKKMAKDMSEQYHPSRRAQPTTKEATNAQVFISLDTREQSLLYCELEFHITTALNDYITAELDKGHLVPDNLKKVSDWWYQQGRPKVIGFRYDLETQLELVNLHLDDFSFHGRRQGNPAEIAGLLHAMKINARAMRIRTFCQPDSVIAKQLVDAQSLFNLINVTNAQQIALAEVAQFFKVIIERERDYRDRRVRGSRKSMLTAME